MQAFVTAIIGCSCIYTVALTHQSATLGASSTSPVSIPPVVRKRLCHYILACLLIPFVKIERCKLVQFLLIKKFLVCATYRLGQPA
nr:MAG TPA: hypothetical protein [Caudoviricetes sp.]